MDIESMREEYESALICREVASLLAKAPEMEEASAEIIIRAICLERKGDGYAAVVPDYGWWAWQASRESLLVELPQVHRDVTWDDQSIDVMWPDEVIKAIHATGIRTK